MNKESRDNMPKNNKTIILLFIIILLAVAGITYSVYKWSGGDANKTDVTVNLNGYDKYIEYSHTPSTLNESLEPTSTFTEGDHVTISINKTTEAANIPLYAHIYFDINEIGVNQAQDEGIKWVLTSGDETSTTVLTSGTFKDASTTIALKNNIVLTTSVQKFTIWLYLNEEDVTHDDITGETLDTTIRVDVTGKGL